jgi:uncharacterized phage-like protein YoqJ
MIIAGTGHRPNKLGGYSEDNFKRLVAIGEKWLKEFDTTKVISGMALGWDQALAQAAINLNIPLIAAIPFKNQDKVWQYNSKKYYKELLSKAFEINNVSGMDDYKVQYMQRRNEWMVDNCDILLAMFDGTEGGTANCVRYAELKNKKLLNIYSDYIKLK